jgi:hypothetical protein
MRRAKTQQQMDMIRDAADMLGYAIERLHTTSQVSVKIITPRGPDPRLTVLCTEDDMIVKTQMR